MGATLMNDRSKSHPNPKSTPSPLSWAEEDQGVEDNGGGDEKKLKTKPMWKKEKTDTRQTRQRDR